MSEIEPPWIATENLELYHLRFHLRSRARQLGSESVSTQSRNAHLDLQLVSVSNNCAWAGELLFFLEPISNGEEDASMHLHLQFASSRIRMPEDACIFTDTITMDKQRTNREHHHSNGFPRMVGDSHNHHDAGVICLEDLADGVYIDIYLLTGITNLSDVTYDPWAICPQSEDFDVPYDSDDFQGCWHETITLVLDSQEFHVPKRLASARLPYVKTYLGSAFAGGSRIELGIEAPAKALDSLLGIIMGGRQYFEDWWDKNDYGGSLELIKVADFLGCTELVMIIEDLLIKELQVDQSVEESLMVCYSSGFPNLARLKCACLHTAAFEVLVRLCRQCNSTHLKSLLPRHKITSWAALTKLVGDHVGDFAWVVSLSGISMKEAGQRNEEVSDSSPSGLLERARRAEAEVEELRRQLQIAGTPQSSGE